MSHNDDPVDPVNTSAPDLQILGNEVTLQPSGFVEPSGASADDKEQALMHQFASFRAEPLQYDRFPCVLHLRERVWNKLYHRPSC